MAGIEDYLSLSEVGDGEQISLMDAMESLSRNTCSHFSAARKVRALEHNNRNGFSTHLNLNPIFARKCDPIVEEIFRGKVGRN